jgi:hypothetical protein
MLEEKTRESFETESSHEHYKSMFIAGFKYYEGAFVFSDLEVGQQLEMVADPTNQYDDHAVELHFKGKKIGFIPRNQNYSISKLLLAGHHVFEAVIQQVSPHENPERQVRIGIFICQGGTARFV